MKKTTGILVAIAACLAAVMLSATQSGVLAADNSRIAFHSDRDGNYEIYVMDADGSNQTRLTFAPGSDRFPAWSSDGNRIAFSSERDGNVEIYVMNVDGSNQTRLTFNGAKDEDPSWSLDGSQIAFHSRRDGHSEIYVMESDGSDQNRLTFGTLGTQAHTTHWSPDGSQIAFSRGFDTTREIWVMAPDGSNQTRLTYTAGAANTYPQWSPDGSQIVFVTQRHGRYTPEIYVINADGSNETRLTNTPKAESDPCWSPDGSRIAFAHYDRIYGTEDSEIWVMNADGSNPTPLTSNNANDGCPSWSGSSFPATLETTSTIVTFGDTTDLNHNDRFALAGHLVLSENSDDIDLLTEDLTVKMGKVTLTIPGGSFIPDGLEYVYDGQIDGAQIRCSFSEVGVGSWSFVLEASSVDVSGTSSPVSCSLAIGNDWGETTERLRGFLAHPLPVAVPRR